MQNCCSINKRRNIVMLKNMVQKYEESTKYKLDWQKNYEFNGKLTVEGTTKLMTDLKNRKGKNKIRLRKKGGEQTNC